MPEYRQDPVSGSWVIIAPERANRPSEFRAEPFRRTVEACPFCSGNEFLTPRTVALYPPGEEGLDNAAWQVRVISNKYPAVLESLGEAASRAREGENGRFYSSCSGYGVHEVIVESPQHSASFAELTADQAYWSFVAYRDRLCSLQQKPGIPYGLVFKNCRGAGGATLEHTHSQVLGTALVPPVLEREFRVAESFQRENGECLFCRIVAAELADGARLVASSPRFVAFCPYASRFPYETWVLPHEHGSSFLDTKLDELDELSRLFQRILQALEKILPQVPHNYWIHSSRFDTSPYDYYHWHIELISRIATQAGFEWGSGCFVNAVAPEDAARALRDALT